MVLQQATKGGELPSKRLLGEHGVREVSLNSLSLGSDGLTRLSSQYDKGSVNVWPDRVCPACLLSGGTGKDEESHCFLW